MSPLSLKVTHRQMREGAIKDCAECFAMEYRMATRMMENEDFFEGVRSVIVDKVSFFSVVYIVNCFNIIFFL